MDQKIKDRIEQDALNYAKLIPDCLPHISYRRGALTEVERLQPFVDALEKENERLKIDHTAVWIRVSQMMPKDDMHMDYPIEYCLRCKCDGSRGSVEYQQGNFREIQELWQNGPYDVIWWLDEKNTSDYTQLQYENKRLIAELDQLKNSFLELEESNIRGAEAYGILNELRIQLKAENERLKALSGLEGGEV